MAHEMGHNFGMSHDSQGCCRAQEDGGCIMAAATGWEPKKKRCIIPNLHETLQNSHLKSTWNKSQTCSLGLHSLVSSTPAIRRSWNATWAPAGGSVCSTLLTQSSCTGASVVETDTWRKEKSVIVEKWRSGESFIASSVSFSPTLLFRLIFYVHIFRFCFLYYKGVLKSLL